MLRLGRYVKKNVCIMGYNVMKQIIATELIHKRLLKQLYYLILYLVNQCISCITYYLYNGHLKAKATLVMENKELTRYAHSQLQPHSFEDYQKESYDIFMMI